MDRGNAGDGRRRRLRRDGGGHRAAPPRVRGHHGARLPVHVHHVRAGHEHFGGSIVYYLEQQAAHIRQALQAVRARGAAAIDVRPEVEAASDREVQSSLQETVWTACDSWYRDESGRIVTNWPGYAIQYARRVARLDPAELRFLERVREPVRVGAA